ncbi:MAG: hypothetical protein J6T34_00655, partial [Bacilli bacterium]|nr:hypothetical protein [Bacilli bacterium]
MKFRGFLLFLMIFILGLFLVACGNENEGGGTDPIVDPGNGGGNSGEGGETVGKIELDDAKTLSYVFESVYTNGEVKDSANGFSTVDDVKMAKVFRNGSYVDEFSNFSSRHDIKMEIYNDSKMRFVNLANGYALTIPSKNVTVDYNIAKYRVQMEFDDSILSLSFESSNPYTSLSTPWYTYGSEWLMEHLMNESFITNNGLERTIPMGYKFSASNPYGDLEFKDGYDCYFFGIKIKDPNNQIERPYYNIAVVRQKNDPKNFILLVMKSKTE